MLRVSCVVCLLIVVRCFCFAMVCCVLFDGCLLSVCRLLVAACCLRLLVRCLLFVAWCALLVGGWLLLFDVCNVPLLLVFVDGCPFFAVPC